jgi:opacity protein-like surface antigen
MTFKTKYLLIAIPIVLCLVFFAGYIRGHGKAESASKARLDSLNNIISSYVVMLDDTKTYVTKIEQELKTEKEARQDGDISRKELRALNIKHLSEISRLKARIDTLLIDISHNGQVINKTDQWLTLNGRFDSKGKLDVTLKMNLSLDVYTGIDKTTKKYTTLVTTDSPYIGIIGIKSQKYDLPKVKRYGIALQVGYGLTTQLKPTPYIGIGIGYNFIQF